MSISRVIITTVLLLSSIAATSAYNITRILENYPQFTQFNNILTTTKVADLINSRKVITVLALNNDRIGDIAGRQEDALKRIISTHVVLDYFDVLKLRKLKDTKTQLTTLYQASGTADDQQGFLDVIHHPNGTIVLGSAMKGAPIDSELIASVLSQPYNISILSISKPIIAPGIDGSLPAPEAASPPAVPPPAESPETAADAPAIEDPSDAPTISETPVPAPGPETDASPADDTTLPLSAAGKQMVSGVSVGLIVAFASFVAAH